MIIEFQGAACSVTGSMHILHLNGFRLLLDCGLFQGRREESDKRNREFPFDPASINAVLLSHAHIDHSGNIPNLVKQGFRGSIYCTSATYDLCQIMLADSGFIHERDAEFVSKKKAKFHEPPVYPLYTVEDAKVSMKYFKRIPYDTEFEIAPGIKVTYFDAGHILGSAALKVMIQKNGKIVRLGFSGDLGRWNMPIIKDPQFIGDVDLLISESTYGGINHDPPENMEDQLSSAIARTVKRGGKVIIPAFSVGRTQDLIYELHVLRQKNKLPRIPIYLDSPLAVNATDIFRRHPECFDEETNEYLISNQDPFGMKQLYYIRSVEDSKNLNDLKISCMIIAASGMCEAGRIRHHLANNIENPNNTILIVGFQAEHTLGKKLVENWEEVRIFGEIYKRKAEVVVLNSFSAHAGDNDLQKYILQFRKEQLKQIFLVHGEKERASELREELMTRGFQNVQIPVRGQKFDL